MARKTGSVFRTTAASGNAAGISVNSASIPKIPIQCTSRTPPPTNRPTAASPSTRGRALPAATTITNCGSIPTSRGKFRSLYFHDWRPNEAGGENGYIAPDPLNPGVIYVGTVTRQDLSNE